MIKYHGATSGTNTLLLRRLRAQSTFVMPSYDTHWRFETGTLHISLPAEYRLWIYLLAELFELFDLLRLQMMMPSSMRASKLLFAANIASLGLASRASPLVS